jgi:glycosyltransferase involved in cell wall biosynthesis
MNELPLVSIVIPCFNHARYVEECLWSVARQDHPRLELVVVDDASTDGTAQVVERALAVEGLRSRFAGGVTFRPLERNVGAHRALNLGLKLASGSVLTVCNSDDRFAPDRLSSLLPLLQDGAELAFSAVRFIDTEGADVTEEDWAAIRLSHTQRTIGAYPSIGFACLQANVAITSGNLLFTRGLFERLQGFSRLKYCHDWDFLLRALLFREPAFSPRFLYDYRLHETNSFRSLGSLADEETREVLRTYFSAVRREAHVNERCPAPDTWPGVFEKMLEVFGFEGHWERSGRSPRVTSPDVAGDRTG